MINVTVQSLSFPKPIECWAQLIGAKYLANVRPHTCLTKGNGH